MLRDLKLQDVYKSDLDNILRDFYFPALAVAKRYDRAVGFFSASTITHAAQALTAFVKNEGKIRLILGAFADPQDIEAVNEGLRVREVGAKLASQFLEGLEGLDDELFKRRFDALAWLVANERLEIKIALRKHGMYHDKVGIIADAAGDAVVFAGSANESAQALLPVLNSESINVFPTWRPELQSYFQPHMDSFLRLWDNKSRDTAVIDLPTAIRERLLTVARNLDYVPDPKEEAELAARLDPHIYKSSDTGKTESRMPTLPVSIGGNAFAIRDHQRQALNDWRTKGAFQGIFELATGAGKTITAIYAVVQMAKQIPGLTVVISAPYQDLADQWCEILDIFNIDPIPCYANRAAWSGRLSEAIHDIEMQTRPFTAIVVVNKTLKSEEFQNALQRVPGRQFLFIGDECHHHGSAAYASALPQNAQYRIGLSATPEHYLDDERNARLKSYYGDIVSRYTLKQAIEDKVLTPYNYFPRVVKLTGGESEDFVNLSNEIARQFGRDTGGGGLGGNTVLSALLLKRARIVASAANKLPALQSTLEGVKPQSHTLFYCGDGRIDPADVDDDIFDDHTAISDSGERQIEVVSQLLDKAGWRLSRFTAREGRRERDTILNNFRFGLIDALVAIKCLDEGIDVPACETAFILASSRDPRQFIQRRGRILRRSPGKHIATIFDFVAVLAEDASDEAGHAKKLIAAELERVAEFSSLAANRHQAYEALRPTLKHYGLEHMV
jgi:superfamily II DNA or RNA helicase